MVWDRLLCENKSNEVKQPTKKSSPDDLEILVDPKLLEPSQNMDVFSFENDFGFTI